MPRFIVVEGTIFNVKEISHVMRLREKKDNEVNYKLVVQVFLLGSRRKETWVKLFAADEEHQTRIFNEIRDQIAQRPAISPVVASLAASVFDKVTFRGKA